MNEDKVKPKVRFITRKWSPAVGGMETYCVRVCGELSKYCELEVIALPGKSVGLPPSLPSLFLFGVNSTLKILFRPAVEVTHIGDIACWPLAWLAKLRNPSGRIVISGHGSDVTFANKGGIRSKIYSLYVTLGGFLIGKQLVIANSLWLSGVAKEYGFQNTAVVSLGTDFSQEPPITSGTHNGAVLFVGRIIKSKGLEYFLEEVLPLLKNKIKIRVAGVLGSSSQSHILNHPDVEFLGSLTSQQLYREYGQALCVVVPSQSSEGFGLVAAEAACASGVVVASNHSGLKEVCSDDVGFLVQHDNAQEWASKIDAIFSWFPQDRLLRVQKSVRAARRKYDWDVVGKKIFDLYEVE